MSTGEIASESMPLFNCAAILRSRRGMCIIGQCDYVVAVPLTDILQ
jgi:hypothetical protein